MPHKYILDKTGFPMIWVDELSAYMHLIPVTKIQFEYMICDQPRSQFSDQWYQQALNLNPRISPDQINRNNYWQALITGVSPKEAQFFSQWCGGDFDLPNRQEWYVAYKSLKVLDAPFEINQLKLKTRIKLLFEALNNQVQPFKQSNDLASKMLLEGGVFEWVKDSNESPPWSAMGKPASGIASGIFSIKENIASFRPRDIGPLKQVGFRLIKRG